MEIIHRCCFGGIGVSHSGNVIMSSTVVTNSKQMLEVGWAVTKIVYFCNFTNKCTSQLFTTLHQLNFQPIVTICACTVSLT